VRDIVQQNRAEYGSVLTTFSHTGPERKMKKDTKLFIDEFNGLLSHRPHDMKQFGKEIFFFKVSTRYSVSVQYTYAVVKKDNSP
jgi:hypothetical protein